MFENVYAVVYLSRAAVQFSEAGIQSLAHDSAKKNEAKQVGGYLCFKNGFFVQYLEGKKATILDLIHTIRNDPRHHVISEVTVGDLSHRHFQGWDMRYLDQAELSHIHLEEVLDWIIEELEQERVEEHKALEPIREMVGTIEKLREDRLIA